MHTRKLKGIFLAATFIVLLCSQRAQGQNPLPTGWLDQDIGTVGVAGSASYSNGVFTIQGAGTGTLSGTSDGLHFAYQALSSDGTIVARVVSVSSPYAQAGVMIRETLDSGASNMEAMDYVGGIYDTYRTSTGSSSTYSSGPAGTLPYWVQVVRSGSTLTGYTSADGENWVQVGSSQTISMAQNVYVGLAVASGSTSSAYTAAFDNVSVNMASAPAPVITGVSATTGSVGSQVTITGANFGATQGSSAVLLNGAQTTVNSWSATSITIVIPTGATSGYLVVSVAPSMNDSNPVDFAVTANPLPTGWLDQDIGTVGVAGSASYSSGTFTVQGAGNSFAVAADGLHFVYQPVSGDGTIVARVASTSSPYALGGIVIRETLNAGAVSMFLSSYVGSVYNLYRTSTGSSSTYSGGGAGSLPYWLELVRSGSTLSAYASADGVTWSQVGTSQTISMAQNVYVGLAVASGSTSSAATVTFDNVSQTFGAAGSDPVISNRSPSSGAVGTSVTISGANFGTTQGSSTVTFNGTVATPTSWSATSIAVPVPTGGTTGSIVVTVSGVASNGASFTVVPIPNIGTLSPASGPVGTAVTISGANFGATQGTTTVTFNGTTATATSWSTTTIAALVPSGATTGNVVVTVSNVASSGVSFTVIPVPSVSSLSPNFGNSGASVTITGTGFGSTQGSSVVGFNGTQATVITTWSGTQIVAQVPSAVTTGPVTVVTGGGQSNTNFIFTLFNPITSSINPSAAPAGGTVVLLGTGFAPNQGSATVQFNNVVAQVSSWSNTSITVTVPANATSGSVTVNDGNIVSSGVQFTVLEPITVTGLTPSSGQYGASVQITGTGFGPTQSNSSVSFNGAAATVTNWSDTQITAVVPQGAATVPTNGPAVPVFVTVAGVTGQGPQFSLALSTVLTDSLGNQTTLASAPIGGVWRASESQGSGCSSCTLRGLISNTFDTSGNRLSRTDALGHVITYTYDSSNNLVSKTEQLNSSATATIYTYNTLGEILTVTDALGNITTNSYDAAGDLLSVTFPAPDSNTAVSITNFVYNSLGELTQITDPLGHITTLTYNSAGLIASITDPQSNVITYAYDSRGNRTSVTDPLHNQTAYAYDSGNRLTTIAYPGGATASLGYDYRGRRTSLTDQNGKTTTYAYDDADRLTTVTDAAHNTTEYAYDTENNLLSITDANGRTTDFAYDAYGRITQSTFPSNYFETYAYDADNNLTSKTDRKGQTIQYVYDALNRLTQKTYPDSTSVEYTYDLVGKVLQVNDPTGTYGFSYDNMGRLVGTTTQYSFLPGSDFTNSYKYDGASNRTGYTAPDSSTNTYSYDTLNRLSTLANSWAGSFGFSYTALSRRTQMTRPNGVATNYSYDNLSRLLSVLHQTGGSTIDGSIYTLDAVGNRLSNTNQLSAAMSNYTYDPLYELTLVTQSTNTTESYSYDPVGNRLASLNVATYTNNLSNELTSTPSETYAYDYNGNTISKTDTNGTTSYSWDFENRLTSVTLPNSGGTVAFKYDPSGRRIYKQSPNATSIFAYDRHNLVETVNGTGGEVARYMQDLKIDEPLAMQRGTITDYFEADGLGSITSLTSSAGAVADTYTFDSFGNTTNSTGSVTNFLRYTARDFDSETNLYFYRARYYDPKSGRFLSEDPIRFRGGQNFYRYVGNNPIDRTDPLGLFPSVHKIKCAIWGLFCLGPVGSTRLQQLQNPNTDYTDESTYTNNELVNPTDPGKRRFQLCVKDNANCTNFVSECGDVVLGPIGDGMGPH